jgi:hypothetical protein
MKARVSAAKVESGRPSHLHGTNRRLKRTHYLSPHLSPRRNMRFSIPTLPGVKLTRAFNIGEIVVLCY